MQVKWLIGCKTDLEKTKRKEIVEGAKPALDILVEMCYNSIVRLENSLTYDNPNWALQQADLVGYKRAYEEIIKICKLKE